MEEKLSENLTGLTYFPTTPAADEKKACPECGLRGEHKMQCGRRQDGQVRLPAEEKKA
ncbi:MAG TPA: hypothetical protein VIE65_13980 [Methylobacter sp.]|jgi:hypothetical protein